MEDENGGAVQVCLRLVQSTAALLRAIANECDQTISAVVRGLLRDHQQRRIASGR